MSGAVDSTLRRNVVCPFCGLGCDDLTVAIENAHIAVREAACDLSRQAFERPVPASTPRLDGRATSLDDAVARAATILGRSRLPLFAGLATDVSGMRAALRLAERTGGIVDHLGGDALFRNLRVVQDSGWMTTTLSEVRNHADFMLVVGPDPRTAFPRFFERCTERPKTLYADAPGDIRIVRLGPDGDPDWTIDRLPEAVAALRCLVNRRPLADGRVHDSLSVLAGRLTAAKYGVVVWAAAAFDFSGGELLVQSLVGLVRDLNQVTRCAALPLGGIDNVLGANQVSTWQTGVPLRTTFSRGVPDHDPILNATSRLLAGQEADVMVWISAFRPLPPPDAKAATIVLAAPEPPFFRMPDVFIPVATPGIDHAGDIFRTDGVVSLRLAALRSSPLPSVATVLDRIGTALARAHAE